MPEFESVTLRDPSSSLSATYVPVAGMVCTSLADDGVEFLGQRRGLVAYVTNGKTMGIPILYPWANRLSAGKYGVNGAVVSLTAGSGGVRAARLASMTGARVAVAEEYRVGGTCVIRGCVPKKLMVYASEFAEMFDIARGY